jgi:hypothetical protein
VSELADRRIETTTVGQLPTQLRGDAVRASTAAGSGLPSSSMSVADLMAVLIARHLRYGWDQPDHPDNDHFILSKAHASPLPARETTAPTVILAKTIKGRGFSEIEDQEDWHPEGGFGSAVLESLAGNGTPPFWLAHPAVRIMPRLGTRTELLAAAAIDASTLTAQRRSAAPT